jgi:hypothetical protein
LALTANRYYRSTLHAGEGQPTWDRFWMNLQSRCDLDVQLETHREELDKIGPLVA